MSREVNKLRNPQFIAGRESPTHWRWTKSRRHARWERPVEGPGITLICEGQDAEGRFEQEVRCKPDKFYRIEAVVECSFVADSPEGGLILAVRGEDAEDERRTSPIHHTVSPLTIRTYYRTGESTRCIRVSVEVNNAAGRATVLDMRTIPILEPDEISHPMALLPPPKTYPPPRIAAKIEVCSATAGERRLTELLSLFFGQENVRATDRAKWSASNWPDALFMPDDTPPKSLPSMSALRKLAEQQIVVISLPAFTKIAGPSLSLRRIEQVDDPVHAEIHYSNHATMGFALHDVFPYAWEGKEPGSFRQNQFRKNKSFAPFCKRHALTVFLASMCDRDNTSHQPIGLHHLTKGGSLHVLDIEPVEVAPSTFGEPRLAMHLLLNILGHGGTQLGQFTSPVRKEVHFRDMIREFAVRTERIVVHDIDAPSAEVTDQLVTVGREDETYGLPLRPKPVLLIRSGLTSGDYESVYGAWVWLKQFIRPTPFECPYAQQVASCFRIAWIPSAAPWEAGDGWARRNMPPLAPAMIDAEEGQIAALIDVVSQPVHRVRIISPVCDALQSRCAKWLPQLFKSFGPTSTFSYGVDGDSTFPDRRRFRWRASNPSIECVVNAGAFDEPAHRDVQAAGGALVRIETPGHGRDFVGNSIERTNLVASALESVIGMCYGLIAVNRRRGGVEFDGFPTVAPGEALILREGDTGLVG